MSFSHTIIFSICTLLIQNVLFASYLEDCKYYKYKNLKGVLVRLLLFTIVINILYILFANFVYNEVLVPNNLVFATIMMLAFTLTIFIQGMDIIFKLLSRVLALDSRTYLSLAINNCMQLAFATLFILNSDEVGTIILYSIVTSIGYTFILYILYFIFPKFDNLDLPQSVEGIPIELLTVSIIGFALFGLF